MLYIVLPVFNRKEITARFVDHLLKQTYQKFQLVLVDDGSTDGTADYVSEKISNRLIILSGKDMWWGGSLDLARSWLINNVNYEDMICVINDDVEIDENYLEKALNEIDQNQGVDLYFTPSYSIQDPSKLLEIGVKYNEHNLTFNCTDVDKEVNCLSTRGLFLSVKVLKKIGPFYPKKIPHYLSDYEYTYRAYKKGFSLFVSKSNFLRVNEETTGIHNIYNLNPIEFMRYYFSNKCSLNPIHFFNFVMISNSSKYLKLKGCLLVVSRASLLSLNFFLVHFGIRKLK